MNTERIIAWDLLKLFAIFLVVLGHCMQHFLQTPVEYNPAFLWIASFHMPLFMALAGLFASKTFTRPIKDYLRKRSRQLLVPWISWSIIIIFVVFIFDGKQTLSGIVGIFINSLWFLKSLFVCGLLALIGFKPTKGQRIYWIILSFIISQVFLMWNVFIMYPCFLFGILCAYKMDWITRHLKAIAFVTGIIFLCSSLIVANSPTFWVRNMGIREMLLSGHMNFADNISFLCLVIVKRYLQVCIGCIGSLFFIAVFYIFFGTSRNNKIVKLSEFGQYTLGIYVLQTVIVETILPYFVSISSDYEIIFCYIIAPVISVICIVICLMLNKLIEQNQSLSALLLGNSRISKRQK